MLPQSISELETALAEAVASKNRFYHRGGYSPYQLVLGENPRLPQCLLSDEALDEVALEDVHATARDEDTAAAAFARKYEIRKSARNALMTADAKSRIREAPKSRRHVDQSFHPGEWVYVYRRVTHRNRSHALQRDRWVGPGAVVWHSGTTVWVAMRTRLWKCSTEQVRPATSEESLGAELLLRPELLISSGRFIYTHAAT